MRRRKRGKKIKEGALCHYLTVQQAEEEGEEERKFKREEERKI